MLLSKQVVSRHSAGDFVDIHSIQEESAMTISELLIAILILLTFAALRFGIPLLLMWVGKLIHNRMLHWQP